MFSDYIAKRRALISANAAIPHVEAGSPSVEMRGDTASWQVIDGEGNAVSMIGSLSSGALHRRTIERVLIWWIDVVTLVINSWLDTSSQAGVVGWSRTAAALPCKIAARTLL